MMCHPIVEHDLQSIACLPLPWDGLAGKTVLITGANGFLPAYMVEVLLWLNTHRLSTNPTTIIGLVRNKEKFVSRFSGCNKRIDLKMVVQDVCEPVHIDGPVDYIIHAASQASPKYYGSDPVGTLSANVFGTHRLLELAREKGSQRFMFFSSAEVYGTGTESSLNENSYGYLNPLDVRSCYAESKRMGENMAASWYHQYGIPSVVVRPFHTYGPGMDLHDGRVFADFVADIVASRDIVMKSDGSAIRAFCYLSDAVAGFFTVLFNGLAGNAYNVGNDKGETSILGLAELLTSLFPERGIKVCRQQVSCETSYLKSTVNRMCPDITRIRALGWEPSVGLAEGFLRTIRSFE